MSIIRFIKSAIPRTYYTAHGAEGERYFSIWKSWFSKCYEVVTFKIEQ